MWMLVGWIFEGIGGRLGPLIRPAFPVARNQFHALIASSKFWVLPATANAS